MTTTQLAQYVDHTLLKADASATAIQRLCQEARDWGFWSVCINPCWVSKCRNELQNSKVRVCTVIGFPLGANEMATKTHEARLALNAGADELDMVLNLGLVKSAQWKEAQDEIAAVVDVANGKIVKVILETGLLTDEEKVRACEISCEAGANFVKTCTGFAVGGATVEDIQLMRRSITDKMKIKASGGIRTLQMMKDLIAAGADRIGTSSAIQFMSGTTSKSEY